MAKATHIHHCEYWGNAQYRCAVKGCGHKVQASLVVKALQDEVKALREAAKPFRDISISKLDNDLYRNKPDEYLAWMHGDSVVRLRDCRKLIEATKHKEETHLG